MKIYIVFRLRDIDVKKEHREYIVDNLYTEEASAARRCDKLLDKDPDQSCYYISKSTRGLIRLKVREVKFVNDVCKLSCKHITEKA